MSPFDQGGVLSYADVSLLAHIGMNGITQVVRAEQEITACPSPAAGPSTTWDAP